MNETLCPVDFQSAGMIIDDEVNQMLINPIPQGVRLHIVIDACHSGMLPPYHPSFGVSGERNMFENSLGMHLDAGVCGKRAGESVGRLC